MQYLFFGEVGSLFDIETGQPKNIAIMEPNDNCDTLYKVFDNKIGQWTDKYLFEIPKTATYAPMPTNLLSELDYYIRSAALVNHKFVWSTTSINAHAY